MLYMHNMHMWQVYEAWDIALSSPTLKVNKIKRGAPHGAAEFVKELSLSLQLKDKLSLSPHVHQKVPRLAQVALATSSAHFMHLGPFPCRFSSPIQSYF